MLTISIEALLEGNVESKLSKNACNFDTHTFARVYAYFGTFPNTMPKHETNSQESPKPKHDERQVSANFVVVVYIYIYALCIIYVLYV